MKYDVVAVSHTGYIRAKNEDSYLISEDERLFAVADGMGGESAGDIASSLAVAAVHLLWQENPPNLLDPDDIEIWIDDAIDGANTDIVMENSRIGMSSGTTIVVAVQAPDGMLFFAHAGDSRIYSSRRGLLTIDHSLSDTQLTKCLGLSTSVKAEPGKAFVKPGDRLLLCTDGLNCVVSDREIQSILMHEGPVNELAESLIEAALNVGGPDNITAVVVDYYE